jgi:hypothetical protein
MAEECEHLDGDYMGKCAICGDMVCGECYQSIFNTMICSAHEELEDEGEWELLGLYTSQESLDERRYYLQEQGITSIVVESEEDTTELYVPADVKEDAFAALQGASEEVLQCDGCQVFFSKDSGTCPICGVRYVEEEA